jgi:tripartite-type tricarboxylate transporter receptor subunit TctC
MTMKEHRIVRGGIFLLVLIGILFLVIPGWAKEEEKYPKKPITLYCSYEAGATTDVTTRTLAAGVEKMLGVPVVVENKAGGGATVCSALIASKKPDGYSLGVITTAALTNRPHALKVAYNPLKDFTLIMQYSRYIGGLCVLSESPIKTIDEFISYAKSSPGLSYGSPGMFTQQSLAVELLAQCKGLTFKHVPFKGGAPANTALMGKHLDFVAGSGQHIAYVKQGVFRLLLLYNADKRNPHFPDVPTIKEIGCQDYPGHGMILIGPKGLPDPVVKKLAEAFKKISEGPEFQKVLNQFDLPYDYKDRAQLEMEVPLEYDLIRDFLKKMGIKKEG